MAEHGRGRGPSRSGVVIGVGLGGFLDGIALHQVLQWHNMGSAAVPPESMEAMRRNMAWDGWFHAATWTITLAGVWLLWSHARQGRPLPSGGALFGQMLLGWGVFNLVEGLIDHHLLGIHHVRDLPAHVPAYDWIFLGVGGVLFILVGWLLSRRCEASRS